MLRFGFDRCLSLTETTSKWITPNRDFLRFHIRVSRLQGDLSIFGMSNSLGRVNIQISPVPGLTCLPEM